MDERTRNTPVHVRAGALLLAASMRLWMRTLDYQAIYYDRRVDPTHPGFRGPCIFLFWHEYMPFLFYLRSHCRIAMLVSRHADAEWLSQAARFNGFDTIRGSTSRGGVAALRELFRRGHDWNLAITPDGPRGPRRRLAPGCILAASHLGIPIVPIGLGYVRPWRVRRAWDRFAIPRPGSRARAVVGPPLRLPKPLDRAGIERYRVRTEAWLRRLTRLAEEWSADGRRPHDRVPIRRQSRPGPTAAPLFLRDDQGHRAAPPLFNPGVPAGAATNRPIDGATARYSTAPGTPPVKESSSAACPTSTSAL